MQDQTFQTFLVHLAFLQSVALLAAPVCLCRDGHLEDSKQILQFLWTGYKQRYDVVK